MIFLGAIIGVGYMTIMIRGFSLLTRPELPPLTVTFTDIMGLGEGEEVRVKGVKIGEVQTITYHNQTGNVEVAISLFKPLELRKGCSFHILSKSPLGGKYVDINPGPPTAEPIDLSKQNTFEGAPPRDLFHDLATILSEEKENIHSIIENLESAMNAVNKQEGPLGQLIYSAKLKNEVDEIVTSLRDSLTGRKKNLAYTFLNDAELAENVREIVLNLNKDLNDQDTPIGILLNDREAGKNLKNTIADLAGILEKTKNGEGSLGKLLVDEKLYTSFVELVETLNSELVDGKGLLPYLLTDPESRKEGEEILTSLREIVVKINEGDSTLAQLVNKPDLYRQLDKLLIQLRESVEDAREQAPVNNLVNMLGAMF